MLRQALFAMRYWILSNIFPRYYIAAFQEFEEYFHAVGGFFVFLVALLRAWIFRCTSVKPRLPHKVWSWVCFKFWFGDAHCKQYTNHVGNDICVVPGRNYNDCNLHNGTRGQNIKLAFVEMMKIRRNLSAPSFEGEETKGFRLSAIANRGSSPHRKRNKISLKFVYGLHGTIQ